MVAVPILSAESLCRVGGFFDGALRWCFGWLFNWCFGWCFCLHLSWLLAWCFGWFPGWWLLGWFLGWCICLDHRRWGRARIPLSPSTTTTGTAVSVARHEDATFLSFFHAFSALRAELVLAHEFVIHD